MGIGSYTPAAGSFGRKGALVSPNDGADLPGGPVKAVVALTAGNLSVIPADNASATAAFVNVSAGFMPPFMVRRVMATGTTCTVMTVED